MSSIGGLTAWSPISPRAALREATGHQSRRGGEKCHTGAIPAGEWLKRRDVTRPRRYTTRAKGGRDGARSGLAGCVVCPSLGVNLTRRFAGLRTTSGPDQPMPITILDLVLLGVMLISGLLAMVRGFMREILSIAAWGAAALVTLYAFSKLLRPQKYFNNDPCGVGWWPALIGT